MWKRAKSPLAVLILALSVAALISALQSGRRPSYQEVELGTEHQARLARHGDEPRERVQSCIALGSPKDTPKEDELARLTLKETVLDREAPPTVVAAAARSLGRRRDPAALAAITQRLEDPSAEPTMVKFAAIRAVGDIGDPKGFDALARQVTTENSVAADAAWAMGRLRDTDTGRIPPHVEEKLIEYLWHPAPKIRIGAIYGLETGGTEKGLAALRELAKDPFHRLSQAALEVELEDGLGRPTPDLILAPCRRAIGVIEARIGSEQ